MAKKILLQLFFISFVCFMASAMAQAETQTVNITLRQPFSENQPPESSRFLAIVRAKRAALEKAVMYIENLSVLKKRALGKRICRPWRPVFWKQKFYHKKIIPRTMPLVTRYPSGLW